MANTTTKKTTRKKAAPKTTEKKVAEAVVTEEAPQREVEKAVVTAPKRNTSFSPDYLVECRSVRPGTLLMDGRKTGQSYIWENDGDVTMVEYQDLFAEVNRRSDYVFAPYFIIEDYEVLDDARFKTVRDFYDKYYNNDIGAILDLPIDEFKRVLRDAPKGIKEAVRMKVAVAISNKEFDSLAKIEAIDEICGSNLKYFAGL
jgi:hypothetical protein